MSAATATSSVDNALLDDPLRILSSKVPQLKAAYKSVDHSGFEPSSKNHLILALIRRALYKEFTAKHHTPAISSQATASPLFVAHRSITAPSSSTSSPAQAVRAVPPGLFEERLAEAERTLRDQGAKLRQLGQQSEVAAQQARALNLIIYNVPDDMADSPQQDIEKTVAFLHEFTTQQDPVFHVERVGKVAKKDGKARPLRLKFSTNTDKHLFLKNAATLRRHSMRCDDDLTRLQQQERANLDDDFKALKGKGHRPFFRGSQLRYKHEDNVYTCRVGHAQKAPSAKQPERKLSHAKELSRINQMFDRLESTAKEYYSAERNKEFRNRCRESLGLEKL